MTPNDKNALSPDVSTDAVDDADGVTVVLKKRQAVQVEVDSDAVEWGMLTKMWELRDTPGQEAALMAHINSILSAMTGKDATKLPARVVQKLVVHLNSLGGMGTEKN
jgi:hypothetical protein